MGLDSTRDEAKSEDDDELWVTIWRKTEVLDTAISVKKEKQNAF